MVNVEKDLIFFIVTYKERYSECETFQTLVESYKQAETNEPLKVFIYDNTPTKVKQDENSIPNVNVSYFSNYSNDGLSIAYNFLGKKAAQKGFSWIILLDQDTSLPLDYFQKIIHIDNQFLIQCPKVYSHSNLISPAYYKNFRSKLIDKKLEGSIQLKDISCINSGLLINLSFFSSIGGYNENIRLDFCDHDFIDKVKNSGISSIGILDINLNQDFSSHNHNKKDALFRYSLFLKDLKSFGQHRSKLKIFFNVDLSRLVRLTLKYKTLAFLRIRLTA